MSLAGLRLKAYGYHNAENLKRSFLFSAESLTMLVTPNMILMVNNWFADLKDVEKGPTNRLFPFVPCWTDRRDIIVDPRISDLKRRLLSQDCVAVTETIVGG